MFPQFVRKILEIYLGEKRIITQSEFPNELISHASSKEAVFVTLYREWRIIASSGRIQCKKENTLFECIDNSLLCLKDERFLSALQTPEGLSSLSIRVDRFWTDKRRVLSNITDLDIRNEGIIFLSQNLGALSVILPNMVHVGSTAESYFDLASKKAWLDGKSINPDEYVIYGFITEAETDFA